MRRFESASGVPALGSAQAGASHEQVWLPVHALHTCTPPAWRKPALQDLLNMLQAQMAAASLTMRCSQHCAGRGCAG